MRNLDSTTESHDDVLRDVREAVLGALGQVHGSALRARREEEWARDFPGIPRYGTATPKTGGLPAGPGPPGPPIHSWASELLGLPYGEGRAVMSRAVTATVRWGPSSSTQGRQLRVPLPWFQALTRDYRGVERTYAEALLVLAYVTGRFAANDVDGPGLLYVRPRPSGGGAENALESLDATLNLTVEQRKAAMDYLEERGLIERIVLRGTVPWWPPRRTAGTYLFVVPQINALSGLNEVEG